jgi:hypothetical protein
VAESLPKITDTVGEEESQLPIFALLRLRDYLLEKV